MIRHPERVKAECLRPLSESEEVCPARGRALHGAFDGRQVYTNFERAQEPRSPIHTCLGGPGRLLVISHDDSPYLLLYYMSRPSFLSSIFCAMNWRRPPLGHSGSGCLVNLGYPIDSAMSCPRGRLRETSKPQARPSTSATAITMMEPTSEGFVVIRKTTPSSRAVRICGAVRRTGSRIHRSSSSGNGPSGAVRASRSITRQRGSRRAVPRGARSNRLINPTTIQPVSKLHALSAM